MKSSGSRVNSKSSTTGIFIIEENKYRDTDTGEGDMKTKERKPREDRGEIGAYMNKLMNAKDGQIPPEAESGKNGRYSSRAFRKILVLLTLLYFYRPKLKEWISIVEATSVCYFVVGALGY